MTVALAGRGTLGVLGGMGPLASAEFLRSIYELNLAEREQDMPRVLLDSDPGFPDRTESLHGAAGELITRRLATGLGELLDRGATRVVLACFTAHHFLDELELDTRAQLVSLVDLALDQLAGSTGRFLMLSTVGTSRARIFQSSPAWPHVADRVLFPSPDDQELVHRLVYRMKRAGALPEVVPSVAAMMARYDCTGVVLGCTEFHLVSRELVAALGARNVVDALRSLALRLGEFLAAPADLVAPADLATSAG
ncbi:MAG TPA: aspartate/glutamate racemase family protein [Pseudonocardiaceae bacterium]|jgi:aspartate racemase|nr:aspartate/glutamate racemase family protein [Pseudonocardiaceae bacterium]